MASPTPGQFGCCCRGVWALSSAGAGRGSAFGKGGRWQGCPRAGRQDKQLATRHLGKWFAAVPGGGRPPMPKANWLAWVPPTPERYPTPTSELPCSTLQGRFLLPQVE